jgi:pimeloyl-ACP methyl ester carboxylesterase
MGARLTALLAIHHPDRVRRAVLAGLAANMIHGVGGAETIAKGFEAPSIEAISDPTARAFRAFAEQTKSDLKALAACMRTARQAISPDAWPASVARCWWWPAMPMTSPARSSRWWRPSPRPAASHCPAAIT